jgi:hypothetical protein
MRLIKLYLTHKKDSNMMFIEKLDELEDFEVEIEVLDDDLVELM